MGYPKFAIKVSLQIPTGDSRRIILDNLQIISPVIVDFPEIASAISPEIASRIRKNPMIFAQITSAISSKTIY